MYVASLSGSHNTFYLEHFTKKLTRRTRNIGEWGVAVADKGMEDKVIYSFGSLWKSTVQQLIFHAKKWINKHVHMFLVIYYYCVAHKKVCWRDVTVEIEKAVALLFETFFPWVLKASVKQKLRRVKSGVMRWV
jgi:hypothetical protein